MFDMNLKYGFMTTYSQTIFPRKVDFGRAWGLEYSPVILHSAVGGHHGPSGVRLSEGLRLGDKLGDDPYWNLSTVERERVRMAFMKASVCRFSHFLIMLTINFSQALEKGYYPFALGLSSSVWHSQTDTMYVIICCVLCQISGLTFSVLFSYFITYFYGMNHNKPTDRSKIEIGPGDLACCGLAKPSSNERPKKTWNGDTTDWKM